jgi:hypothetical protein
MRHARPLGPIVAAFAVVLLSWQAEAQEDRATFRRADANASGTVDIADPIFTLGCLFTGSSCTTCEDAADSNDDGEVDVSDPVHTLGWLFLGGPTPPRPGPSTCGTDPTEDDLGLCVYPVTECAPEPEVEAELADTLSRLHYAAVALPDEEVELEDVPTDRPTGDFPPRSPPYDPRPGPGYSWNSAEGRRLLLGVVEFEADREGAASHAEGSIEAKILSNANGPACVEPDFYVTAGDRTFSAWPGIKFQAPGNAFPTKLEAEQFLRKVYAAQPFFLPFTDPDVRLGHGWYYSSDGGLHRACDYSRSGVEQDEDPTFMVTSCASGVVQAAFWDHNSGNTVAVEHTAPGGQKVMILYMHLRNGRSNDVANAKSSTSTDDKYVKYRAFATDYPEHLSWGTESQLLKVEASDTVGVHTEIGFAGNTGAGGAGSGLNEDGSPKNWKGNVHLHVYFAVPHPTVTDTWVWVDPYGVYERVDTGCYDLLQETRFSRLYAPFYPTFHGVPYEVVSYYFGYYVEMGRKLRTINVHRKGEKLLVSGSFQTGIPGDWKAHGYMTGTQFQEKADLYWAAGLVPRETTVEKTLGGSPRYTAIWREVEAGESLEHRGALTDPEWVDTWEERVVGDEWRLEDYFGYSAGGTDYQSVLVTSVEGRPFLFSGNKTSSELDTLIDEYKADGFLPVSFSISDFAGGRRYSGIFRDLPGCWKLLWGSTPSQYQGLVSDQVSKGYRVWKVQGYADSTRYGVIFHADPGGPCP